MSKDPGVLPKNWTRKAWSAYCNNKPAYKSGLQGNSSDSQQNGSSGPESNEESENRESKKISKVGRPRKFPLTAGVTAVIERAKKKKQNMIDCKGRGRPKKNGFGTKKSKRILNFNGLDLLHAQTVLSISSSAGTRLEPAPGCIDQKLDTTTKSPNVPNVVIRDTSLFSISPDLNCLLEIYKQQMLKFIAYMQTPEYKETLKSQYEEEKVR